MFKIAIIGAGNLGSRHLQGLAGIHHECEIHIVDPDQDSRESARVRFAQVPANPGIRGLYDHRDISLLPKFLDLAIVATTSDIRLGVIRKLLEHGEAQYLLLEKVLFPRVKEYAEAAELLQGKNVRTWVNCARRLFDLYNGAREKFHTDRLVHMDVTGGNWGLGCNGIHFLDLMAFLTGEIPECFDTSGLAPGAVPSKRPGFLEFSGTIMASTSGCSLSLTARPTSSARHLVTLRGEHISYVIDETAGKYWKLGKTGEWNAGEFHIPFQSQMTGGVADQILSTGECGLTQYAESSGVHQPFLEALIKHVGAGQPSGSTTCLIT